MKGLKYGRKNAQECPSELHAPEKRIWPFERLIQPPKVNDRAEGLKGSRQECIYEDRQKHKKKQESKEEH